MEERLLERKGARDLADAAMVSRSEWYRRMAAEGLERPVSAHRRLQLERAAYRLLNTRDSVSELGLGAGYGNTSGFTRAFRRTYGVAPRDYRRCAPTDWRIPPLGGLHYAPAEETPLDPRQGTHEMKLIELWLQSHAKAASTLVRALEGRPEVLDKKAKTRQPFPWHDPVMKIDDLVGGVCRFGEPWIHMLDGRPKSPTDRSLASRLEQIEENRARLQDLMLRFEEEGSWDMTFVDHECEPPETFSYGGVILMVIVFADHLRVELDAELRERGLLDTYTALA